MRHNILFFLIMLTTFVSVWGAIAQFPFPHHIWNGTSITYVPGEIAIILRPGYRSADIAPALRVQHAAVVREFDALRWGKIAVPDSVDIFPIIEAMKPNPAIEAIEPIMVGTATVLPNDPYFQGTTPAAYPYQWALQNTGQSPPSGTAGADIHISGAWDLTTGSSTDVLAILDSGIPLGGTTGDWSLSHEDLSDASRFIIGPDYVWPAVQQGRRFSDLYNGPRDENGHGTHVTGIAAASSNNGTGIAGVNWKCKVLVCQVFDKLGGSADDMFRDAVIYAVDYGAKVINFSGGWNAGSATLLQSVSYAESHNVDIVAAAANAGAYVYWPAAYSLDHPNVIAVGATDPWDIRASYSNFGSQLDMVAPGGFGDATPNGKDIWSTAPGYATYLFPTPTNYGYLSGTSMATPMVAGLASLLRALNPTLNATQVACQIWKTCDKVGGDAYTSSTRSGCTAGTRNDHYGAGRTNALKAVTDPGSLLPPLNFAAVLSPANSKGVQLSWNPPTANSGTFLDYRIYRNNVVIATCTILGYYDCTSGCGGLSPLSPQGYTYSVSARYGTYSNWGESPKSNSIFIATGPNACGLPCGCGLPSKTVARPPDEVPMQFALWQNSPNPFNPSTEIRYELPENVYVSLTVSDVLGREVAKLAEGIESAGKKSVTLDAARLPSGVYFYRLQAGSFVDVKKMILMR